MSDQNKTKQTKSRKRVSDHGEVFTAEREVNAMLDLVKQETERIDSRFLEPACGNGNFLSEILRRKLAVVKLRYGKNPPDYERYAIIAISSIYGVEILPDNVAECRERLFQIWDDEYQQNCKAEANQQSRDAVRFILEKNILCGDALTLTQADGSPIIFAEWSPVNHSLFKRRDFALAHMLKKSEENSREDLFSNTNTFDIDEHGAKVLKPFKEYPPIHYHRLAEHG